MKKTMTLLTFALLAINAQVWAHCQVPCGVFTDEMRFSILEEDFQTIEKAMVQIKALSGAEQPDLAKITRWTITKEDHANKVQKIVTEYFMAQRIKLDTKDYEAKIRTLHAMLISAMKAKQTLDTARVDDLRKLTKEFHGLYFPDKPAHGHHHEHGDHGHKH